MLKKDQRAEEKVSQVFFFYRKLGPKLIDKITRLTSNLQYFFFIRENSEK